MIKQQVIHHCELFSLEEHSGRSAYGKKMSEVLSDEKSGEISVKEIIKKYKESGPDGTLERDEVWKLIEWSVYPDKGRKPMEKNTLEEDIP